MRALKQQNPLVVIKNCKLVIDSPQQHAVVMWNQLEENTLHIMKQQLINMQNNWHCIPPESPHANLMSPRWAEMATPQTKGTTFALVANSQSIVEVFVEPASFEWFYKRLKGTFGEPNRFTLEEK